MKCSGAFSTEIKMKVKKMLNFTKTLDYKVEESGDTESGGTSSPSSLSCNYTLYPTSGLAL